MILSRASFLSLLKRTCGTSSRCFSSENKVHVTRDDEGLATVTLADPPVNSLSVDLLACMSGEMKNLNKDNSVKGILITSKFNGQVFSAGLNIYDMFDKSDTYLADFWKNVQEWYLDMYGCEKPIVAAVNGHAPAGGCATALMADYRVMMKGKRIGLNETQLGIAAPFFFADLMTSAVGRRQSELALLHGAMYTAEDALKIGMVDEVSDVDNVSVLARHQLSALTKIPQPAYLLTKRLYRKEKLDRLITNRDADIANFVGFVSQPGIQKAIGRYLDDLKRRKK